MKREEWVNKALKMAEEHFELIDDFYITPDFVQVVGNIGGDYITYRYYKNGTITER